MTNIDLEHLAADREYWDSVAPDGALYYILGTGIFVEDVLCRHSDRIIPRPPQKAQEVEWDGEGVRPPVNTIFEFSVNGVSWEERVMMFDDGITCLIAHRKYTANRWHYKSNDPELRFRTIRTKEQRLRDEFIKVVVNIASEHSLHRVDDIATKVFDDYLSRYNLEPKQ